MRELSKRCLDFNVQCQSAISHLTDANRARPDISDERNNQPLSLRGERSPAYQADVNPDTHTAAVIEAIRRIYKKIDPAIRDLLQQIKNNRTALTARLQRPHTHKNTTIITPPPPPQ